MTMLIPGHEGNAVQLIKRQVKHQAGVIEKLSFDVHPDSILITSRFHRDAHAAE
jgi:hypothetical protein